MGVEIQVKGLTKSFGRQVIWQDVSLTLPAGEISDGSSCLVPPPWCDGQDDMDRQQDPGSRECS